MFVEEVDCLRKWENAGISRENHCHGGDSDEQRLDVAGDFFTGGGIGEK